jgi:hypothetical protein
MALAHPSDAVGKLSFIVLTYFDSPKSLSLGRTVPRGAFGGKSCGTVLGPSGGSGPVALICCPNQSL